MNWYVAVLKNYVGFNGRAGRQEFWMFVLFNIVIDIVLSIVDLAINSQLLAGLYGLAVLLPSLAVAVRRLHDTGRSGWWILIGIIPIIGWIVLIVFYAAEGQPNANQFGPTPRLTPVEA